MIPESESFVDRELTNHPPSRETQELMEVVRSQAHKYAYAICDELPNSREKSLAKTHLEQSLMWAMAALARDDYDNRG